MRYPIVVAVAIGCVAASPHHIENRANNEASAFQITASSRDSGIDSLKIKASKNALHLGSPVQDACCNQLMAEDAATFYLKDTELFLYSPGNPKQQIYVDSDTDGASPLRYYIGSRSPPTGAQTKGWSVNKDGALTFNKGQLSSCSDGADNSSIWISKDGKVAVADQNCTEFTANISIVKNPTSCLYSGEGQVVSFFCLN